MTLQRTLHALSFEPVLARLLAGATSREVTGWARWIEAEDPFGENQPLRAALRRVGGDGSASVTSYLEHAAWCAWRQAKRTIGVCDPLPVRLVGRHWLEETEGSPTILVCPMTLATADAIEVVAQVLGRRPCVVYGEEFAEGLAPTAEVRTVGAGSSGLRRILETLRAGGALCTYADFVYAGHQNLEVSLFGLPRAMSMGFLRLASRPGTMLLPSVCLSKANGVIVHVEEPVEVAALQVGPESTGTEGSVSVEGLIAGMLERLIRLAPDQWRLLPTLTFECPQFGDAQASCAHTHSTQDPAIALQERAGKVSGCEEEEPCTR